MTVWVEILCSNGDRAEALDPESAVAAAFQIEEDHFRAVPCIGRGADLTFTFLVDGVIVRTVTGKGLRLTA